MPPETPSQTFHANRVSRNLGSAMILMMLVLTLGLLTDPNEGFAVQAARADGFWVITFLIAFLVGFSLMGVGLLAHFRRHALVFDPDGLTVRGIFRTRYLPWNDLREAVWRAQKYPSVLLRSDRATLSIDLSPYSYSCADRIVAAFRRNLDPSIQRAWDRFALLAGLDDQGLPLPQPNAEPDPIPAPDATDNQARWDHLFPYVAATGASFQVIAVDVLPPSSSWMILAFVPVALVALWPAPTSFPPSGSLQWLRTMPEEHRREAIDCLAMLAKMVLVGVGLILLIPILVVASSLGALLALHRFAPQFADPETAKLIGASTLLLLTILILIPLERRRKRDREQRLAEHHRMMSEGDSSPST
ncbi:PH domain-containing protein [Tautonia marina]|uniref:PH domain-containing protein n=1 Tax=Tautonia marina TaxID=2653855 RepID=UPI001375BED8|nr:PH domain-containing protein [Tautonia marina]